MNKLENLYLRGFCRDCSSPIEYCACDEMAFTEEEYIIEAKRSKSVNRKEAMEFKPLLDCAECTSFNCTECPRYTVY